MLTVSGYLPTCPARADERVGRSDTARDSRAAGEGAAASRRVGAAISGQPASDLTALAGSEKGAPRHRHAGGNRRLYAVDPEGIDALRGYFDRFWTQALDAFKKMAEHTSVKEEP
jgi:hypothetical protein